MTKPNDFFSDDLSDLLGGDTAPAARELPQDEAFARIRANGTGLVPAAKAFEIPCYKCKGSGAFIGYTGRRVGACFTCKGKGTLSRKTSPVQLERAAERRQEQKEAIRQEAAPQIAWIIKTLARGDKLPATFADILRSCLEALQAGRILSEGRQGVVDRGMARDAAYAAQKTQAAPVAAPQAAPAVDVSKIVDAFQRAQEAGLKRFTLRFQGAHFQVDRNDPTLVWVSEGGYGTAKYGRIAGGVFRPGRDATAEVIARIVAIAADPLAAGIAYAQVTSSCSVCGRHLENQDSVDAGIGPVCAGRLNRPGLKFERVDF
jgi:hypothetical protein